jgi:hypothetical protein
VSPVTSSYCRANLIVSPVTSSYCRTNLIVSPVTSSYCRTNLIVSLRNPNYDGGKPISNSLFEPCTSRIQVYYITDTPICSVIDLSEGGDFQCRKFNTVTLPTLFIKSPYPVSSRRVGLPHPSRVVTMYPITTDTHTHT